MQILQSVIPFIFAHRGLGYSHTKAQVDLMNDIRMLWEQHGVWTRSAITSIALNLPDVDFVVKTHCPLNRLWFFNS